MTADDDRRRAFLAEMVALHQEGRPAGEIREMMAAAWRDRIGRATLFRWLRAGEEAIAASLGLPPPGRRPRPGPKPKTPRVSPPLPVAASAPPPPAEDGPLPRVTSLPLSEMLGEVVTAIRGTLRYAVGDRPHAPRNPNLALRAATALSGAITTALDVHRQIHDARQMEQFTDAIMTELRGADPAMAQRIMERLEALTQTTAAG